jgi:hypothetical protein
MQTYVAVPDLNQGLVQRRAGGNIHHSDVQHKLNACLGITDVLTQKLVIDVVGAFSDFRSSHTCGLKAISVAKFWMDHG